MSDPYGDLRQDEPDWGQFDIPEPPPRGTVAWRRMVLEVCATEDYDSYAEAIGPLWKWRGWRLGVDIMTELLSSLSRGLPAQHRLRDGFGQVRVDRVMGLYTQEQRLNHALELMQEHEGPEPAHEVLASYIASAQKFGEMLAVAVPVWQGAVTAMGPPHYDQAAGAAVITRHLNTTGTRSESAATMSMLLHGTLRSVALPAGSAWIDAFLSPDLAPQVAASRAVFARGDDVVAMGLMDQLADTWVRNGRSAGKPPVKFRKGVRVKGCQRCGSPDHR